MKKEEIEYTKQLSRIGLSSEEKELFEGEFKKILGYIDKIQEVSDFIDASTDTKVGDTYNVTREDVVLNFDSKEKLIELFPEKQENYLSVKKVIE